MDWELNSKKKQMLHIKIHKFILGDMTQLLASVMTSSIKSFVLNTCSYAYSLWHEVVCNYTSMLQGQIKLKTYMTCLFK